MSISSHYQHFVDRVPRLPFSRVDDLWGHPPKVPRMDSIFATCANGHDVLEVEPGTPCPRGGSRTRNVHIFVSDSARVSDTVNTSVTPASAAGTAYLELSAGTAAISANGTASIELRASGYAEPTEERAPVVDRTQEVLLRWTPLDDTSDTWMLQVHKGGETVSVGVGSTFVRAVARVAKDLYPEI